MIILKTFNTILMCAIALFLCGLQDPGFRPSPYQWVLFWLGFIAVQIAIWI